MCYSDGNILHESMYVCMRDQQTNEQTKGQSRLAIDYLLTEILETYF